MLYNVIMDKKELILKTLKIILITGALFIIGFDAFIILSQPNTWSNLRLALIDIGNPTAYFFYVVFLPVLLLYYAFKIYFKALASNEKFYLSSFLAKGLVISAISASASGFFGWLGCAPSRGCWGGPFILVGATGVFVGGFVLTIIFGAVFYLQSKKHFKNQ